MKKERKRANYPHIKDPSGLMRVDNPDGHQVCQIDAVTRTVAIQNRHYKTLICFRESGGYDISHQKVDKITPTQAS